MIVLVVAGITFSFVVIFVVEDLYVNLILPVRNPISQDLRPSGPRYPAFLVIPKINVSAAIEYVALTSQGVMAVPAGSTSTAWFDLGPRPGEIGSAVIAGHEGWKDGIGAVFDDLNKLRSGDKVYVESMGGATTTFVVSGTQIYDQNGDATDVFSSSDGKAHLNLITCEGTWNAAEKSYSNRLVVFTDKE